MYVLVCFIFILLKYLKYENRNALQIRLWCIPICHNSLSMVYGSQAPRTTCHFHQNWVLCGSLSGLYFSRKLRTKNSLSLVPVCSVDSPTRVQKVAGCPSYDCYFFHTVVGRLENIILPVLVDFYGELGIDQT